MTYEEADADALRVLNEIEEKGEKWRYLHRDRGLEYDVAEDIKEYYIGVVILDSPLNPVTHETASYAITIPDEKLNLMTDIEMEIKRAVYYIRKRMFDDFTWTTLRGSKDQ